MVPRNEQTRIVIARASIEMSEHIVKVAGRSRAACGGALPAAASGMTRAARHTATTPIADASTSIHRHE